MGDVVFGIIGFGGLLALLKFAYDIKKDGQSQIDAVNKSILESGKDMDIKLTALEQSTDGKIGRVYQRLDEVKTNSDCRFVNKDVCDILHKQLDEKLKCIPEMQRLLTKMAAKMGVE